MSKYLDDIQTGMDILAEDPRTIFVGQATKFKGHAVTRQLEKYPQEKKIEFPVAENFQMGFCLGLALQGYIPISIYPRHDFLILALDQLLNHIDRWQMMHGGNPKVIIKALVGAKKPLDGGHQHTANYIDAIRLMCQAVNIKELRAEDNDIVEVYKEALYAPGSYLISEYTEAY